jgi:uncharacterized repeat protein (TIGR03806 family)
MKSIRPLSLILLTACTGGAKTVQNGIDVPGTLPPQNPPVVTAPVGLDVRPENTSCVAGDAPGVGGATTIGLERAFTSLPAVPGTVHLVQAPGNNSQWYVTEKAGRIYRFANSANVATRSLFIDLTTAVSPGADSAGDERGLFAMAFHPDYPANPRAYLSYTATNAGQLVSRVVEYQTQDTGLTLAAATARVILQINQPESNHNGGHIAFGPDGYLYVGIGDGGGGGDGHGAIGNGQRLSTLLGKMLRINVNSTTGSTPYAIPSGNPYVGNAVCNNDTGAFTQNCPEIYAYGFRNPWRWSFDRGAGQLWVADVGQGEREEVDRVSVGGNYGWRCLEGTRPFNNACGPNPAPQAPVAEYDHTVGVSITGGVIYRGSAIPSLRGQYVFGDAFSQRLFQVAADAAPTQRVTSGIATAATIVSFAEDQVGEVYVVDLGGALFRLVGSASVGGRMIPTQLSQTGCVLGNNAQLPATGLIPYAPNAPFWSDSATKTRYLALPDGQRIGINIENDFEFPVGSVLMKNFQLNGMLIETRLFMRHNDGVWAGYSYEWNDAQTDATRVTGGKVKAVGSQQWVYPSEAQCLQCHTAVAGHTLGLEVSQQNGLFGYPNGRAANQLHTLNHINILSPALSQAVDLLPAMPDPYSSSGTLTQRARAWLHTNCAQCHRPGGGAPTNMDLRYTTPLASTNACEALPNNALGILNARLIAVGGGDPASRSMVVVRSNRTDGNAMPPITPRIVDAQGVALLAAWVNALVSCN